MDADFKHDGWIFSVHWRSEVYQNWCQIWRMQLVEMYRVHCRAGRAHFWVDVLSTYLFLSDTFWTKFLNPVSFWTFIALFLQDLWYWIGQGKGEGSPYTLSTFIWVSSATKLLAHNTAIILCSVAMSFINKSFHLSVQAKTKKVNLRVLLKGAFYTSPLIKASTLACSINGRAKNFVVYIHLRILQAVGINSGDRQSNVVRYSVRLRVRKLWFRLRGKYAEGSNRDSVLKAVKSVDTKKSTRPVGGNFLTRRQVKGNIKDENEGGMFGRASSVKRPSLVITRFWPRRKNAGNKILPQVRTVTNCSSYLWGLFKVCTAIYIPSWLSSSRLILAHGCTPQKLAVSIEEH